MLAEERLGASLSERLTALGAEVETQRLRLCKPQARFAEALTTALNASYRLHHPYLTWARDDWTVEQSRRRLAIAEQAFAAPDREYRYYLLDPGYTTIVGCVGMHPHEQHVEIGYWANALYARQGYLSEALHWLLAPFAKGELRLTTSSRNMASQGLAKALGFSCHQSHPGKAAGEGEVSLVYWR